MKAKAALIVLAGMLFAVLYAMPASAPPTPSYQIVQQTFTYTPSGSANFSTEETIACPSGKSNVNGATVGSEPGPDFPGGSGSGPGGGLGTWKSVTLSDNGRSAIMSVSGNFPFVVGAGGSSTFYSIRVTLFALCVNS